MSKNYRGKGLWKLASRGRGTCPICNATRIKLLYDITSEDGSDLKVCKRCKSRHGK